MCRDRDKCRCGDGAALRRALRLYRLGLRHARQDGIEFLEAVREGHRDLPFILYTGKGSEEVASDAISAGVTDYLQKGSGTDQYNCS